MIGYDAIDPGIRRLVCWLNERGFVTTDSGDGVSKPDMECALGTPNVFMASTAANLISDARRLASELTALGVALDSIAPEGGCSIQATFDPIDESAFIALCGVSDADLPVAP